MLCLKKMKTTVRNLTCRCSSFQVICLYLLPFCLLLAHRFVLLPIILPAKYCLSFFIYSLVPADRMDENGKIYNLKIEVL